MGNGRKGLYVALAMLVGGTALFLLFLGITGDADGDKQLGLLDWVVGGALIGPGFGYLIKWRTGQ